MINPLQSLCRTLTVWYECYVVAHALILAYDCLLSLLRCLSGTVKCSNPGSRAQELAPAQFDGGL